jgi:hypothetical protein
MSKRRKLEYQWPSVTSQKNERSTFRANLLKWPCELTPVYDGDYDDDDDDDDIFIR